MGKVFKFEFLTSIKKKSFIISVAIMFAISLLISFIPSIISKIAGSDEDDIIGIYSTENFVNKESAEEKTGMKFENFDSPEKLEEAVKAGDIYAGYVIAGDKREVVIKTSSVSNMGKLEAVNESMSALESSDYLRNAGVDEEIVEKAIKGTNFEPKILEADGAKNFWLVYLMLMILYTLMMMFGNQVAMSVAREKSDRTMELLITSTKPKDLIRGKVFATAVIGVLVVMVLVVGLFIGTKFGPKTEVDSTVAQILKINISIDQFVVSMAFFIVGYIMFLYLFACAASLVSKIEDLGMAIQPLSLIYVAGFMISMFGMSNPGTILRIASIVPFTSPFAMITRYGVDFVPQWELFLSFGLLAVFTVLVGMLAVKIYRYGALNYGTKPKFFKNMAAALKKKNN